MVPLEHVDPIAWQDKTSNFTNIYSFGNLIIYLMMKIKDMMSIVIVHSTPLGTHLKIILVDIFINYTM